MATPSSGPVSPAPSLSFGGYAGQPGSLQGVPFWPRAGARLIDLLVHYFVSLFTGFFFGIMLAIVAAATHTPVQDLLAKVTPMTPGAFLAAILGELAYHVICEGGHGSTLGKLALGMVVVQDDGTPCRPRAALIRSLAYYLDSLFFGIIAYTAMQKSAQQQRYGDQWAHTVVVKRSQLAPEQLRSNQRFVAVLVLAMMADAALLLASYAAKVIL